MALKVLGIETSCDETAAAIVSDDKQILAQKLYSQVKAHAPYGGVVPEIASREHIRFIDSIIMETMQEAGLQFSDLDAIAVTAGPGLIGGVIVGVMAAKGLAAAANLPLIGVNHLEGHALTVRLTNAIEFPYLLLLVSGGHCQILIVHGVGEYTLLGKTLDDALGEAFDKTAKLLGMGYPGGPAVERMALEGREDAYKLPRPLLDVPGSDFSFSGLKTAVNRLVCSLGADLSQQQKADICASFQAACGDIVCDRMLHAIKAYTKLYPDQRRIAIAGGVAANRYLFGRLQQAAEKSEFTVIAPPLKLCTDNAAMIAWAGIEQLRAGVKHDLSLSPRARWPLYVA